MTPQTQVRRASLGNEANFQRDDAIRRQQATFHATNASWQQHRGCRNTGSVSVTDAVQAIVDPLAGMAREVPPQSRIS